MSINKSGSQVYFEGMFTGSSGDRFKFCVNVKN